MNAGFLGHDLHGLAWGPDGRLYFSVGDRGFHVTAKEGRTLGLPRRGAVFRCQPDGTELEVLHIGLRNPQELAFDECGNLFTADNNCDKGDHSRLVWIVPGGDSGWNMAYQTIPAPYETGPWHAERIWHLAADPHPGPLPGGEGDDLQPAWLVPPLGKLGAGPSGFAYNATICLPDQFRGRFFLCNYTGNGGIETFRVQPKGASFELVDPQDFLKPIPATDCDFGYDGKLYVSDFVGLDWNGASRGGRIYTVYSPQQVESAPVARVAELFRERLWPPRERRAGQPLESCRHARPPAGAVGLGRAGRESDRRAADGDHAGGRAPTAFARDLGPGADRPEDAGCAHRTSSRCFPMPILKFARRRPRRWAKRSYTAAAERLLPLSRTRACEFGFMRRSRSVSSSIKGLWGH